MKTRRKVIPKSKKKSARVKAPSAGPQLQVIGELLAKRYLTEEKKAELTDLRDPFLLGAWYILGQHAKRNGQARAFEALRRAKGLTPGRLLDIAPEKLAAICQSAGPYEDARSKDLYAYADAIEEKWGQDFAKMFKNPLPVVRKFLEEELHKPPAFADFLLLYGGQFPVFALSPAVARVVTRLGFGKMFAEGDFARVYHSVQQALAAQTPKDAEAIIYLHGLLHRLGLDLCHAKRPACEQCPLKEICLYVKAHPIVPKAPLAPGAAEVYGGRWRP